MLRGSSAGAAVLSVLVVLGCSDPAAPPPRGSATVQLSSVSPPVAGKSCPSQGDPIFLGESGVGPSGSAKGRVLTDDEGGASVSCSVSGGDEVKFSGQLKKAGGFFQVAGTVTKGGSGKALISVFDPSSTDRLNSPEDTMCDVHVDADPLSVGEDSIWASYSCPKLVSNEPGASNPNVLCDVDISWFYFDQCK